MFKELPLTDRLLSLLYPHTASSSSSSSGRPTVAEFVNELTEVENQVSQQQQPPRPSQSPGVSPTFDARQPKPGRYTASAATKELDELMANLSGFKMPAAQVKNTDYEKECFNLLFPHISKMTMPRRSRRPSLRQ